MAGIGPGGPGGTREPVLPRGLAHLGIGQVVVDVGHFLGHRILRPHALRAAGEADLFLSIGTSLQVYPIAGAFEIARAAGAKTVIVNAQPTPFDDQADAVFPDPISELLPAILGSAAR